MISQTAYKNFARDPIGMEKWYMAQELVTPHERSYRLRDLAVLLARKDLVEASTWFLEQPNNPERDIAEEAFAASSAARNHWAASLGWAADISDPNRQLESLTNTFNKAWNRETESLSPELLQAAEEAGMTQHALHFIESKNQERSQPEREK